LLLFDSVEAYVTRQSAKRCGENWERFYPRTLARRIWRSAEGRASEVFRLCRVPRVAQIAIFFVIMMLAIPTINGAQTQQSTKPTGSDTVPEAAIPAILAAFDKIRSRSHARSTMGRRIGMISFLR